VSLLEPLERQRAETLELLDSLSEEQLAAVHAGSGWSVLEILAHVARAELGEAFLVRQTRDGQVIEMSVESRDSFNEDGVAAADGWDRARLRAELDEARDGLREAFAGAGEPELDLPISWPEWPAKTIRESIPYMVAHEDEHVAQVRDAVGR
jgi:uncharacterized damage-inducible protein DinB